MSKIVLLSYVCPFKIVRTLQYLLIYVDITYIEKIKMKDFTLINFIYKLQCDYNKLSARIYKDKK